MNASAQPISPFHHLQQQQQTSSGSSTPQQNQQQMSQQQNNNNKPPPSSKSSTNLRRGPWSPDEDRKLIESINLFGATNWVRISQALGSRTPKQCRERYHQNLKPSLNRNPISPEEGQLIEELVAKYGKRWAEIARHLNGRSDNAIKNWWNGGANRRRRASSQAILQETHHHHPQQQPLPPPPPPQTNHYQDYPQQHPPHFNSPSFNTQIFQQNQQGQGQHLLQQPFHSLPPNQHQTLPPLHATQSTPAAPTNSTSSQQQQQPLMLLSSLSQQQMLPPANVARSASLNQEIFQQQQPGVKRFLEEQHIPLRRHSAQTILTSNPTSSSPFSASPLSRGPSSRNSSISYDYQQQQQPHTQPTSQSGYFSEYSNNTSRRSSIAHDIFPNPFQYQNKRQNSTTSSTSIPPTNAVYLSPSFKPHRGSASGLPSNLSTLSSNNTTSSNETTPIFKSDFGFECKNDEQDGEGKGDGKKKVMNINNLLG